MLTVERHSDVTALHFTTWRSRTIDYSVRAFVIGETLIDTGFPSVGGDLSTWLDSARITGVVVTHYHEDHAGNVESLARRGLPIAMAPATEHHLRHLVPIGWYRRFCWGTPTPLRAAFAPFAPAGLDLIHTPGHSDDHHIVWHAETGTLFGADLFLGVKVRVAHPAEREDVRAQVASLERAIALQPARYFDAHRGLVPNPAAQLTAKRDWMVETIAQIDAAIANGAPDHEIVRAVFGGEDRMDLFTNGDYARRNFVASLRATGPWGSASSG
jgi:glyoxylase-like metal-dependent hydrolase (beta-lactamase superfamily II)